MNLKGKSILIFGAGINQLPLISAARDLSVRSIVIDPDQAAPGRNISDVFEVVKPDDYRKTKHVADSYNVDGIVTGQMENPLLLMARLAEDNGYRFPSRAVIRNCRNKYLMKQAFIRSGVPCARGILLSDQTEITKKNMSDFSYPVIIKPTDSHSSRGVFMVNSLEELRMYFSRCSQFSSDKKVIVEEYLEGRELSIEAITYQGNTRIIQYTDKTITPAPFYVEMGHFQPASLSPIEKAEIDGFVDKAITSLGIKDSASHTELKITRTGIKLIEVGARLGGDFISSDLTLASTGTNMNRAAIQVALGIPPDINHKGRQFSFIRYFGLDPGRTVIDVLPFDEVLKDKDVVFARIFCKKGEPIREITDSSLRAGCVLVKGDSREEVIRKADFYSEELKKRIITI